MIVQKRKMSSFCVVFVLGAKFGLNVGANCSMLGYRKMKGCIYVQEFSCFYDVVVAGDGLCGRAEKEKGRTGCASDR